MIALRGLLDVQPRDEETDRGVDATAKACQQHTTTPVLVMTPHMDSLDTDKLQLVLLHVSIQVEVEPATLQS